MRKQKKGQMGLTALLVVAVIVGLAVFLGTGSGGGSGLTITGDAVSQEDTIKELTFTEDTTVTVTATDAADGEVTVNGLHQYQVNGGALQTVANGGTFTASPGDVVTVNFGSGNTSYLNSVMSFDIPDKGTANLDADLWQDGVVEIKVFNEDNDRVDATTNITLGAGDDDCYDWSLEGQSDRGEYSHGGVVVVEFGTNLDDVEVLFDVGNEKTDIPEYQDVSAAGNRQRAYTIPALSDNMELDGRICVESDDNNDPTAADSLDLTLLPNEYRYNSDTKMFELFAAGEDEDGNRVSNPIATDTAHVGII